MLNPLLDSRSHLEAWFSVLKRFNGNYSLKREFRQEIEKYFDHNWTQDRTLAFKSPKDLKIFNLLPHGVRYRIYQDYLFDDFLELFKPNF